jgi:CLASP N terminal
LCRSQVVREACITIAFLSQNLQNKLDHFAESVLPHLINLIPSSTKVMASSGFVAVRFIIRNTHGSRLIPIFTNALSQSKAKEIRRACCEFVEQIMATWPPHTLERHVNILQESIKKGIADADPEARLCSRRSVTFETMTCLRANFFLLQSVLGIPVAFPRPSRQLTQLPGRCVQEAASDGGTVDVGLQLEQLAAPGQGPRCHPPVPCF